MKKLFVSMAVIAMGWMMASCAGNSKKVQTKKLWN